MEVNTSRKKHTPLSLISDIKAKCHTEKIFPQQLYNMSHSKEQLSDS